MPQKYNHRLNDMPEEENSRTENQASSGLTNRANSMEWVMPRWASRSEVAGSQKEATISISGMFCARAPSSRAFFPSCLPAIASPMQAPKTMWVRVSKIVV